MNGPFWTLAVSSCLFGAVVGSFLNVLIHRVPLGESIVFPASRCPACGEPIAWYDNIPVISWLILGGRCRHCDTRISARYPLVEGLMALLSVALWFKIAAPQFDPLPTSYLAVALPFLGHFIVLALLVAITFVDLDYYIIPHVFTLPGIAVAAGLPWALQWLFGTGFLAAFWPPVLPWESVFGLLFGAGSVLVIYYSYYALRGYAGIGGGDVTLMALVGAWLGWPALIFVLFASSLQGTLAAGIAHLGGGAWLKHSSDITGEGDEEQGGLAVPFGPFIALAAVEHFFAGAWLPDFFSMAYLYQFGSYL
jgi:leader peptidase (prepilin peptidase)/N-methyltransferase